MCRPRQAAVGACSLGPTPWSSGCAVPARPPADQPDAAVEVPVPGAPSLTAVQPGDCQRLVITTGTATNIHRTVFFLFFGKSVHLF